MEQLILTDRCLQKALDFMEVWIEKSFGVELYLFDANGIVRTETYADVKVRVSKFKGNKIMSVFLKSIVVEFNVVIDREKDLIVINRLGISFEHIGGGRNGWDQRQIRFVMNPNHAVANFVEERIG